MPRASEKIQEPVEWQPGLLENVRKRGPLDGAMSYDRDLERLRGQVLLHPDVAASLPHDDPTVSLQGTHDLFVGQAGDLGHTAISTASASGLITASSSTGSR